MNDNVIFKAVNLTKKFGDFVAVNNVSFEIKKSEIVAIVGENGAGKSTVCKMMNGIYSCTSGQIIFEDKEVVFKSAADSIKAGIGLVYQERNLIPLLTGAQNVCINSEPLKGIFMDEKRMLE